MEYLSLIHIFNNVGCIALQTEPGEVMAKFADSLQEKLGYDIEIITISRPTAYGEYEPYHFVKTYDAVSYTHLNPFR